MQLDPGRGQCVMTENFDVQTLAAAYAQGCLIPFTGSGMSRNACRSWQSLVEELEKKAGEQSTLGNKHLIQRAYSAIEKLRRGEGDVASAVKDATYNEQVQEIPEKTRTLASLFWPLICTTNYDDIYLRANWLEKQGVPRLLGRSEKDCYQVLRHLSFPTSEALWAIQGMLQPRDQALRRELGAVDWEHFGRELVIGHAEYRKTAHNAPHFRRCFAELFRSRSLLFLGSGLAEPYFLTLFDEIIELTGPPSRPHFAIIPEDEVDADFLKRRYHILCNTYPPGRHEQVDQLVSDFVHYVRGRKVAPSSWGFRMSSPTIVGMDDHRNHFRVIRGGVPKPSSVRDGEVVAVSCGRDTDETAAPSSSRGHPGLSPTGRKILGMEAAGFAWKSDWFVQFEGLERAYGIVAREPIDCPASPDRRRRSPRTIHTAFVDFLSAMQAQKVAAVHTQLLAAGRSRTFERWVSLIQMARAYGDWFRQTFPAGEGDPLQVNVYAVDLDITALLEGGFVDIVQQLNGTPLHIEVETTDALGHAERYHEIVREDDKLSKLVGSHRSGGQPRLDAYPAPRPRLQMHEQQDDLDQTVRDFGLVSGSTLFINYQRDGRPPLAPGSEAVRPHLESVWRL